MQRVQQMNVATISRDCGSRLASYIEGRRRELIANAVRSPALERPGAVTATALANAFLDRLCQEIEVGDRDTLDVWVDTEAQCVDAAEQARIVVLVCASVGTCYARDCGTSDEVLAYLTLRSLELERRFRVDHHKSQLPLDAEQLIGKDEIVGALLAVLEARDQATSEHSRAVGTWCGRIAKGLGMNVDDQRQAVLAGILHDIGKIATPSEILLKPGPLDSREWEIMREHARVGATIVERIGSLAEIAPIVAAHHERMDGRGYPAGLTGKAIPRLARVISVADSFHAMISKRPYRSALTIPSAMSELRAGSGTQWDATIVDAMFEIIQPTAAKELRAIRIAR